MKTNYTIIGFIVMLLIPFTNSIAQTNTNSLSDKIVIVIHMQEPDEKDELSKESNLDVVEKINQVIKEADPENVIYAKSVHKILNLTLKKIYVDKIIEDLDDRLKIVNQNVFTDEGGDVFKSDELNEFIKGKNTNQIVIVGRVAEGCITKSTLSGKKLGYDMYIIPDAIIGQSEESKSKALNKLKEKGIQELVVN